VQDRAARVGHAGGLVEQAQGQGVDRRAHLLAVEPQFEVEHGATGLRAVHARLELQQHVAVVGIDGREVVPRGLAGLQHAFARLDLHCILRRRAAGAHQHESEGG